MTHQGNDVCVPDTANNMMHNVQDGTQATTFESTEISNKNIKFNLVSSHYEPQVKDNGKLQIVTNNDRRVLTKSTQAEMEINLQTPQVDTTSISSRGRNSKMSATIQHSVSQQDFFGCSYYISASHTFAEGLSPSVDDDGARHAAELQLHDRMCNPIAFDAEMMGDIIYFHQAFKQKDAIRFYKLLWKESMDMWTRNTGKSWSIPMYPKMWKSCHKHGQCDTSTT